MKRNLPKLWNTENSSTYNYRKLQYLNKKIRILRYIEKHGCQPDLQKLFTRKSILEVGTYDFKDIKIRIRDLLSEIDSIEKKLSYS